MNMTDGERARKSTIGTAILVLVCFFNTVPLFIISILANLSSVRGIADLFYHVHAVFIMPFAASARSWAYLSVVSVSALRHHHIPDFSPAFLLDHHFLFPFWGLSVTVAELIILS